MAFISHCFTGRCALGGLDSKWFIEPAQLGHCQVHEHLMVRKGPATRESPSLWIDDEALSLRGLRDYNAASGRSVVDCQPGGAGRDVRALHRMGERSGVQTIASTGYHLLKFYLRDQPFSHRT